MKTNVAFCVHDSVILDFSDKDRHILVEVIEKLSKTKLGDFKINVRAGKDYGSMKELKV